MPLDCEQNRGRVVAMACSCTIDWAAIATFAAVVAALGAPYVADGIEKRRRRAAAMQLAELMYMAIDAVVAFGGGPPSDDPALLDGVAYEVKIPLIDQEMGAMGAESLGSAEVLNSFVRLRAIGQAVVQHLAAPTRPDLPQSMEARLAGLSTLKLRASSPRHPAKVAGQDYPLRLSRYRRHRRSAAVGNTHAMSSQPRLVLPRGQIENLAPRG
jgi:hypothetical protein